MDNDTTRMVRDSTGTTTAVTTEMESRGLGVSGSDVVAVVVAAAAGAIPALSGGSERRFRD